MIQNVIRILCGFVMIAFVACGNESNESSTTKETASNTTKSVEVGVESTNHSKETIATDKSKTIAQNSKDSTKDSKDLPQAVDIPSKNPKDLYKKCIACHGARGDKVAPGSAGNIVIADLNKQILIEDMKGYRAKTLSKGGTAAIMYLQANGLSDEDIEILGEYISNFKK